jgi:hypothetical protein
VTLIADPSAGDLGRPPDAVDASVDQLTARLVSARPDVEPARLREMVLEAYEGLERAPVQNFRIILTERAVRARLHAEHPRPTDLEAHDR